MMILRNIIIISNYFITTHVHIVDSLDYVSNIDYTISLKLRMSSNLNNRVSEFFNVSLDKKENMGFMILANLLFLIELKADKAIFVKELNFIFNKNNILPKEMRIAWKIDKPLLNCFEIKKIKSL